MSTVKLQHYVPQFYIRNFCNSDGKIYAYDKLEDKSFPSSPKGVGGERYFYDCEEMAALHGDKQLIEKYLGKLESEIAPKIARLIDRLRTNNFSRLHPETRAAISVFTAFQLIRSKVSRITSRQIREQMIVFLNKHKGTEEMIMDAKKSMTEEEEIALQCKSLLNLPFILKMANIIEQHIWIIKKCHPSGSFWIGDQPIIQNDNIKDQFRSNSGIASLGIEIHIPISCDYLIGCYERSHFAAIQHLDGKMINLDLKENVPYYRQFQVRDSLRFIYSSEPDFTLAKEMCAEHPFLRDPERKWIATNHDE